MHDGARIARWRDSKGKLYSGEVKTTAKGDTIAIHGTKYIARFKDGTGTTRTVATGCRDESAARAQLVEFERRAELVRSGVLTAAQADAAEHGRSSIGAHLDSYIQSLHAKGDTERHCKNVRRLVTTVFTACKFRALRDVKREAVETWLARGEKSGRSARTRNTYLAACKWFMNYCVDVEKITANPLARIHPTDEKADRRRQPRALSEDEIVRLLDAARRRPLEQARLCNRGWRKNQPGVRLRPETVAKVERLGAERALAYKTMLLTGLRLGELSKIRVCDLDLDGPSPHIVLDARHEKSREGSTIPLRADLAEDLRRWVTDRSSIGTLFRLSPNLVKTFDRDLRYAGITKRDERGRTACVHSLRHSFATLMSRAGVAPRVAQAAMRHASVEMTLQTYTDPKLLDVGEALLALPKLTIPEAVLALTGAERAAKLPIRGARFTQRSRSRISRSAEEVSSPANGPESNRASSFKLFPTVVDGTSTKAAQNVPQAKPEELSSSNFPSAARIRTRAAGSRNPPPVVPPR